MKLNSIWKTYQFHWVHRETSVGESLKEESREAIRGKCGWKSESRIQRSIPWSVGVLRSVQGLSYLDRSTKTLHLKGTHVLPVIVCQSPLIDTNPPWISWFSLSTSQKPHRRGRSRHSPYRVPWMWWTWRRHKALSHTTRWQCPGNILHHGGTSGLFTIAV